MGGVAALLWLPSVRVPHLLAPAVTALAGASLFVYLTHWQVYPHLEMDHPLLALLSSLAVGVAYWWLTRPALRRMGAWLRSRGPDGATTQRQAQNSRAAGTPDPGRTGEITGRRSR